MKRITFLSAFCVLLFSFGSTTVAQNIQQSSAEMTVGDDGNLHPSLTDWSGTESVMATTISTIFAAGNGGDLGGAVYFDITVGPSDITITDMETHTAETGPFSMDIYVFPGTYVGNETDPSPWGSPASSGSPGRSP